MLKNRQMGVDTVRRTITAIAGCAIACGLCGCSTARRLQVLDAKVQSQLRRAQQTAAADSPSERLDLDAFVAAQADTFPDPLQIDLKGALALAAKHSREYQTAKEGLYSAAVSVVVEAHGWDWNVTNSLGSALSRDFAVPESDFNGDARLGLNRRFLSGARLTTSLAVDVWRHLTGDPESSVSSLAQFVLTQPLLSGSGPVRARLSLTRAERSLIDRLRAYIRDRESLLLDVATRYYAVLSAMDGREFMYFQF